MIEVQLNSFLNQNYSFLNVFKRTILAIFDGNVGGNFEEPSQAFASMRNSEDLHRCPDFGEVI